MSENGLKRTYLEFGGFRLYSGERLLIKDGARVPLTPRVLDLLIVLVSRHGQIVSKEALLDSVWSGSYVEEGNINKTVSNLRKSLGAQTNGSDFIETVPKTGYRFIAPVAEVSEEPEPEVMAIPWSAVQRPVIWAGTVAVLVVLVIIGSSFVPNRFTNGTGRDGIDGVEAKIQPAADPAEPVQLTFDPSRDAYPDWRRDERIRYQNLGRNNQGESHIMDANGENQSAVTDIPGMRQGSWSPDGKRLIFWRYDDPAVYLADADGSKEKKLPFILGGTHWSADGSRLVYQGLVIRDGSKDWDIFVYDVNSGRSTNLTNNPEYDSDPSWAPSGEEILFNSIRDGNYEIYRMRSDGSGLRRLTDHPAWDSHPTFSPDGTQILFNSNRENADSDIYLMNADGGEVHKVVDWRSDEEIGPGCWSADGTKIAFVSNRSGNDDIYVTEVEPVRPQPLHFENENVAAAVYSPDGKQLVYQVELSDKSGELRVLDVEGGEVRSIFRTANWYSYPAWSPDGSRIAFQNNVDGKTSLFYMRPDGSGLENLIEGSMNGSLVAWSPDCKSVVFIAANYGVNRVYTLVLDTGELRPLTPNDGWESDPAWSPDGRKIVFSCDRQDVSGNGLDICLMDADGKNETRLLSRKGHDLQPSWSPDGGRIAFMSAGDGNNEIYVMRSDGTGLLRVTRNAADDSFPSWSPDGTKIIFTSNRGGRSAIYEIAL